MVDIYTPHRLAMERFYNDKATVYTIKMIKDPITKVQEPTKVVQHEDIPCLLEFMSETIAIKKGLNFATERKDLLIISPDIYIEAGSKIEVLKQSGRTYCYDSVGEVIDMKTHNEYYLAKKEAAL